MDCDDQVRLVKRDNDSHANALDFSRVTGLSTWIPIKVDWFPDNSFHVVDGAFQASKIILGVSRQAHRPSRAQAPGITPLG
jgi:hypothetical protein